MNPPSCLETVHDGHVNVENDHARRKELRLIDCLLAIGGFSAHCPTFLGFQQNTQHAPDVLMVVYYQNFKQTRASDVPGNPQF